MAQQQKFLVADLFCGAGGFSEGARLGLAELGIDMELVCVNHWPVAIGTHELNFPQARHYCQDIASVRPHLVVPEGRLDLLLASPSCTHHSVARGGKPTSDQQRSDPWHVITWLTELDVDRAIIENVWEYTKWGPVDPKSRRPIKEQAGLYFEQWVATIRGLRHEIQWLKQNAADFGDATTRRRFIAMVRKIRALQVQILWPVVTHAKRGSAEIEAGALKPWRPAREIICWEVRGKSIFARKVPLAPKTIDRVLAGEVKYDWPPQFIIKTERELLRSLLWTIADGLRRRHRVEKIALPAKQWAHRRRQWKRVRTALARLRRLRADPLEPRYMAMLVEQLQQGRFGGDPAAMQVILRNNGDVISIEQPAPAVCADGQHLALAEAVISQNLLLANRNKNAAKNPEVDPIPPATTSPGGGLMMVEALTLSQHNTGLARPVGEPFSTIMTGGAAAERPGCARPAVVEPVIMGNRRNAEAQPVSEAQIQSLDTKGGVWLAEPTLINMKGRSNASDINAPAPTQTAHAPHLGVAEPVIVSVAHGNEAGDKTADSRRVSSVDDALGALHAGGGKYGLAAPFVANMAHGDRGGSDAGQSAAGQDAARCTSTDESLGTFHAEGNTFALVQPAADAFVLNRQGIDGGRADRRATSVEDPAPVATTRGAGYLVAPAADSFLLSQASGGSPRAVKEPAPTIVAGQAGSGTALISPYYGSGSGETCKTAEAPLDAVTAKARFGVVVPVTNGSGGPGARSTEEPIATPTTAKRGEFAIAMPVTHDDASDRASDVGAEPLPGISGASRGDLAFIAAQFGERPGQAPRVHGLDDPAPAICATGHVNLIEADLARFDVLFRMLIETELAAAMGMEHYKFSGTKTEIVKQIGNAVSRRLAQAHVKSLCADAAPEPEMRRAAE